MNYTSYIKSDVNSEMLVVDGRGVVMHLGRAQAPHDALGRRYGLHPKNIIGFLVDYIN